MWQNLEGGDERLLSRSSLFSKEQTTIFKDASPCDEAALKINQKV